MWAFWARIVRFGWKAVVGKIASRPDPDRRQTASVPSVFFFSSRFTVEEALGADGGSVKKTEAVGSMGR